MACKSIRPVKCVTPFIDDDDHLAFRAERSAEEAMVGRAVMGASGPFRPGLQWLLPGCFGAPDPDPILGNLRVFEDGTSGRDHLKGTVKPRGPTGCGDFCSSTQANVTATITGVTIPPNLPAPPNITAIVIPTIGAFVCPTLPPAPPPFEPGPCCCFTFQTGACACPCPLNAAGNCFIGFSVYACIQPATLCSGGCNIVRESPTAFTQEVVVNIVRGVDFVTTNCQVLTQVHLTVLDCGAGVGGSGVVSALWFSGSRTLPIQSFEGAFCGLGVPVSSDLVLLPSGFAGFPLDPPGPLFSYMGYGGNMLVQAGP